MKRIILMLTVAALLVVALTVTAPSAFAKISPAEPPSCENKSGHKPPGKQPSCGNSEGLIQNPGKCAANPTGKCPPGQN
jgi:hypothetical protein